MGQCNSREVDLSAHPVVVARRLTWTYQGKTLVEEGVVSISTHTTWATKGCSYVDKQIVSTTGVTCGEILAKGKEYINTEADITKKCNHVERVVVRRLKMGEGLDVDESRLNVLVDKDNVILIITFG